MDLTPGDELMHAMRARVRRTIEAELTREANAASELRARVVPLVREAVAAARRIGEIEGRAWLVGSYAWGQPTAASDVDVLVEACADRFALMRRIEGATHLDVDVIIAREADAALLPHLIREGIAL